MMTLCELCFWGSVLLLGYTYAGYPALLLLASRGARQAAGQHDHLADGFLVSVVIAARNEGPVIRARIANVLAQAGPVHEVIVGSDGSSDATVTAAASYPDKRVRVLDFPVQRGKTPVINDCVAVATGDIVVFTDAATLFKDGFLEALAEPFADPAVGVAVGKLLWRSSAAEGEGEEADEGPSEGEGAGIYWSLELALRSVESRLGLLATATGACMAVRRSCFEPLLPDEDVDFTTPIQARARGFTVAYVPRAVATDVAAPSARAEFRARSRMVTKNFVGTMRALKEISPVTHPGLWWSLLSHKVLRWLTPIFVVTIPFAVLGVGSAPILLLVLGCYGACAAAVMIGACADARGLHLPVATHAWHLAVVNAGMLAGLIRAAGGQRISVWQPVGTEPDYDRAGS